MWSWFILAAMFLCGILAFVFYIASVRPAAKKRKIDIDPNEAAQKKRNAALILYSGFFISYIVYAFFPINELPIPSYFHWQYYISFGLGVAVGIPSFSILFWGIEDSGKGSITSCEHQGLYGGIYNHIRHPQIVGEYLSFWSLTFLLHSPFLCLLNFLWFPAFWLTILAEEKDLLVRFGDAYADYIKRVGCVFPRLLKVKKRRS